MQSLHLINNSNRFFHAYKLLDKLRGLYFRQQSYQIAIYKCKCIHTMFFTQEIDVAFLDENFKVVRTIHNLKPWKIAYCNKSYCVLERFSKKSKWYKVGEIIN